MVLPWVPATATPCFMRMSSASISARGITGIPASRAATTSTFVGPTAEERTTTWQPSTCSAACPTKIRTPRLARRWVVGPSRRSEPETTRSQGWPRPRRCPTCRCRRPRQSEYDESLKTCRLSTSGGDTLGSTSGSRYRQALKECSGRETGDKVHGVTDLRRRLRLRQRASSKGHHLKLFAVPSKAFDDRCQGLAAQLLLEERSPAPTSTRARALYSW